MKLIFYEWRKLFYLPALWIFIGLCLLLNGVLIISKSDYNRNFFNDVSVVANNLGEHVDDKFKLQLKEIAVTEDRKDLLESVSYMYDIFDNYNTKELTEFYKNVVSDDLLAQNIMVWKYDMLQNRVEHLAQTDASLDLYAGPITYYSHQYLFGTIMRAVITEGILIGMLSGICIIGYEGIFKTNSLFCTTCVGRKLWCKKVIAAILSSLIFYILLSFITLGNYFILWDYTGIWTSSVSSQFNYIIDMFYVRPFITWLDLTVGQYITVMVIAGGGLTVIFTLLATMIVLIVEHIYASAIAIVAFCIIIIGTSSILSETGLWTAYMLTTFSPINLWLSINSWFTEMGISGVVPFHETIGIIINLIVWGGLTLIALQIFKRKDML